MAMTQQICDFKTNQPPKILEPFVDLVFSEGYMLGPQMVGTLPGSTPTKDIIQTKTYRVRMPTFNPEHLRKKKKGMNDNET